MSHKRPEVENLTLPSLRLIVALCYLLSLLGGLFHQAVGHVEAHQNAVSGESKFLSTLETGHESIRHSADHNHCVICASLTRTVDICACLTADIVFDLIQVPDVRTQLNWHASKSQSHHTRAPPWA